MHSGKLWSPEGHGFTPQDSEWWSGLIRRARLFHQLFDRDRQLDIAMQRMAQPRPGEAGRTDGPAASPAKPQADGSQTGGPGSPVGAAGRAP